MFPNNPSDIPVLLSMHGKKPFSRQTSIHCFTNSGPIRMSFNIGATFTAFFVSNLVWPTGSLCSRRSAARKKGTRRTAGLRFAISDLNTPWKLGSRWRRDIHMWNETRGTFISCAKILKISLHGTGLGFAKWRTGSLAWRITHNAAAPSHEGTHETRPSY